MNKGFLLVIGVFAICTSTLFAAPAAPIETIISQPDGTTFTVRARGDEYANWMETTDGHTVIKVDQTWYYAKSNGQGGIEASNNPVGSLNANQLRQVPMHIAPVGDAPMFEPAKVRKLQRPESSAFKSPGNPLAISHTQYVLTILVSYSDTAISNSDASFQSLIYGASNSVKHFYLENSYNGFSVTAPAETQGTANDGIIRVSRPVVHPNQGVGNENGTISRAEAREIVQLADTYINYASYDTNADGAVSADELAIVIIVAGYETSYGGAGVALTPSVWGHQWTFASNITLDGKTLSPYTMFGEKHGTAGGEHLATIGIMCHELGHLMLNLPDLYDTKDPATSEGIGNWGLMGVGSWNYVGGFLGNSPSHLSAWSKVVTNFTIPEDIDFDQNSVNIAGAESSEVAKRIWVDKYKSVLSQEYFLVENRQQTGYDAGLPGAGLLIWHIDEGQNSNQDENHKLVDLEEADGLAHLDNEINRGDAGDSFPGSSNNTTFNNTSNPNSKNYADANVGISVTSISPSSANMTANFTSLIDGVGDHVRYDRYGPDATAGYGNTTIWLGLRVQNDTEYEKFDGVDIYINDAAGATVDIYYYTSMTDGLPAGLIHSKTGLVAGPGWSRLLLDEPQPFPIGAERGVVVRVVNVSSTGTIVFEKNEVPSGRSYFSSNGAGIFNQMCSYLCGDISMIALVSGIDFPPTLTPAAAVSRQQGSPAGGSVAVATVSDVEIAAGSLVVTQIAGGTATGITVSGITNNNGNVTATLAASCSANSGTVRFQVSDGAKTAIGDLQVNVTPNTAPIFGYGSKAIDFAGASTHATTSGPSDNGTVDSITVVGVGGFTGNISVALNGEISISDAQPVGNQLIQLTATDNCNLEKYTDFTLSVAAVVPAAPSIGTATAGDGEASVSFVPSAFSGGVPIDYFTVTATPGGLTKAGVSSPITLSGLSNGQAYTFTVTTTNYVGTGPASAASNSVTPIAPQSITFANPGDQKFGTSPTLIATASSGLSVMFSSTTPFVCTITSGGMLTFVTSGICSIDADQEGDTAWLPAAKVSQSFMVNPIVEEVFIDGFE